MMEKEMRESTLANILSNLTKEQVTQAIKWHNKRFTPKYRAFSILQNKIEEVLQRTTRAQKNLYKKTEDVYKEKVAAKLEERRKRREEKTEEEKKAEEEENKKEREEEEKYEDKGTNEQKSVQDTQL